VKRGRRVRWKADEEEEEGKDEEGRKRVRVFKRIFLTARLGGLSFES
jgi:hypothetical protein